MLCHNYRYSTTSTTCDLLTYRLSLRRLLGWLSSDKCTDINQTMNVIQHRDSHWQQFTAVLHWGMCLKSYRLTISNRETFVSRKNTISYAEKQWRSQEFSLVGINVGWYGEFFQGWQKQFESGGEREGRAPYARDEASEALKGVEDVERKPPPQKFLAFLSRNGVLWWILRH